MSDLKEWAHLVADVGFPMVLASWLLLRHERTLKELHQCLDGLKAVIREKLQAK